MFKKAFSVFSMFLVFGLGFWSCEKADIRLSSPEMTVMTYLEALEEGDMRKMNQTFTEPLRSPDKEISSEVGYGDSDMSVNPGTPLRVSYSKNRAEIYVMWESLQRRGRGPIQRTYQDATFSLKKVRGNWLIYDMK